MCFNNQFNDLTHVMDYMLATIMSIMRTLTWEKIFKVLDYFEHINQTLAE
jgi:hypothetical protein